MPLPKYVAVIEFEPTCSEVPRMLIEQDPPLSVQSPNSVDPEAKLTVPVTAGGVSTYPAGAPPATVAVSVVD